MAKKKVRTIPLFTFLQVFFALNSATGGEVMDLTRALLEFATGRDFGPYTIAVSVRQALEYIDRNPIQAIGRGALTFGAFEAVSMALQAVGAPKYKTVGSVRLQLRN